MNFARACGALLITAGGCVAASTGDGETEGAQAALEDVWRNRAAAITHTVSVLEYAAPEDVRIGSYTFPPEITPMVLRHRSGVRSFLLSSSWTQRCTDNRNPLTQSIDLNFNHCIMVTKPDILGSVSSTGAQTFLPPANVPRHQADFTYDGVLGYAVIGANIVFIGHGEHQNAQYGQHVYRGDVYPDGECPDQDGYAGYKTRGGEQVWENCWGSFASFASISSAPFNSSTGWMGEVREEGPVVWPSTSLRRYDSLGVQRRTANGGFYQPTMFYEAGDPDLYVYFVGTTDLREQGRVDQCISVARAPAQTLGAAGTFHTFYRGAWSEPSLPEGFDAGDMARSYDAHGGRTSCIFGDAASLDKASTWFNVARVRGTPYYLGVEERMFREGGSSAYNAREVGLRISTDLVHWTPLRRLAHASGAWGTGDYIYPTFVDRTGSTNYEVDARELYIFGKSGAGSSLEGNYALTSMRLSLSFAGLPSPPLTRSREEKLSAHYYSTILGWTPQDWDAPSGIQWHAARFGAGETCGQVLERFVTAPSAPTTNNDEYVTRLYRALLLRAPDAPGKAYWVNRLNVGTDRVTLMRDLASTAEAASVCRAACDASLVSCL